MSFKIIKNCAVDLLLSELNKSDIETNSFENIPKHYQYYVNNLGMSTPMF
jgi:hypothetical protein